MIQIQPVEKDIFPVGYQASITRLSLTYFETDFLPSELCSCSAAFAALVVGDVVVAVAADGVATGSDAAAVVAAAVTIVVAAAAAAATDRRRTRPVLLANRNHRQQ